MLLTADCNVEPVFIQMWWQMAAFVIGLFLTSNEAKCGWSAAFD